MKNIIFIICLLFCKSLFSDNILLNTVSVQDTLEFISISDTLTTNPENVFENIESFEESEKRDKPQKKEISFTKDDIIDYAEKDKTAIIHRNDLGLVGYHNKLRIGKYWMVRPQLTADSYYRKLENFGVQNSNQFSLTHYPYEVSLTRLFAGLGDYDKNFAQITIMKNQFLNVNNTNFRADFKAQDELIENFNHKSADSFLQFTTKKKDWSFSSFFFQTNRELLSKNLYFSNNFNNSSETIKDRWLFYNFEIAWKTFFINYTISENYLKSNSSNENLKFDNYSFFIGTTLQNKYQEITLTAQKDFFKNNLYSKKFNENLFTTNYILQANNLKINTDFIIFDRLKKIDSDFKTSYNLFQNISLILKHKYSDNYKSDIEFRIENQIKNELLSGFGYNSVNHECFDLIDLTILAGKKKLKQYGNINNISEDFFTFNTELKTIIPFKGYHLKLYNRFNYDNISENFLIIPEYSNLTDISVIKKLHHDNKIALGSRMYIISDIIDEAFRFRQSDPVVDIYFSVGITKLFDINIELNNIYRNMYFGDKTLNDFHFTTNIIWYFLN